MARLLVDVSPSLPVHWAGWRTTTGELAYNGWNIATEENHYKREIRFIFHNKAMALSMMGMASNLLEAHIERFSRTIDRTIDKWGKFPIHIQHVTQNGCAPIRLIGEQNFDYAWVDAKPANMIVNSEFDLQSLPLFAQLEKPRAEELIVEPQDVMQLLDQIKRMQAQTQQDIRERNRKRENIPQIHATILSFKEAA